MLKLLQFFKQERFFGIHVSFMVIQGDVFLQREMFVWNCTMNICMIVIWIRWFWIGLAFYSGRLEPVEPGLGAYSSQNVVLVYKMKEYGKNP